jgi:VWFA-related protein
MRRLNDRWNYRWIRRSYLWLFIALLPLGGFAQQITLRTRSNLVLVPTLVENKTGGPVFNLGVEDFMVKDNGVEQKIHLDENMDKTPMSIVLLVQVGGSAVREFHKMTGLPTMLTALAGDTRHRVAVVEFDSQPRTLLDFSNNPNAVEQAVYSIQPGDGNAAILDSVWYAVDMLADEPPQNQRVIVLLSETRDHGSRTPIKEVVRKIGRSDVVVYSLACGPVRLFRSWRQRQPACALAYGNRGNEEKHSCRHSEHDRRPVSPFQRRKTT